MPMTTLQIRMTERLIKNLDADVRKGIYPSRSEAVRAIVRRHYHG